jgi:hypothetical protein
MKRDRLENQQWMKFLEHWWFLSIAIIAIVTSELFAFFLNLSGTRWIYFFIAGFTLMTLGAALITFAKFPAYLNGRFFTFGIKSVPERLAGHYKWGGGYFCSA